MENPNEVFAQHNISAIHLWYQLYKLWKHLNRKLSKGINSFYRNAIDYSLLSKILLPSLIKYCKYKQKCDVLSHIAKIILPILYIGNAVGIQSPTQLVVSSVTLPIFYTVYITIIHKCASPLIIKLHSQTFILKEYMSLQWCP